MKEKNLNKDIKMRESGIELLKIIALFLIIISHVVQTVSNDNTYISWQSPVIDINHATTNVSEVILLFFQYFGVWGNSLFFVCSAWFLIKTNTVKKKKILLMLAEIWTVSIVIMVITFCIFNFVGGQKLPLSFIVRSIFPTMFNNNWYMTCYILFYPLSSILNGIINRMNKIQLFRITCCLSVLYIFIEFIKDGILFRTELVLWVTIYFVIAYIQKYLMVFMDNVRVNVRMFLINLLCLIGLILVTEIIGLNIPALSNKMGYWIRNNNPFLIFMSIAMLNLARNVHFKNKIVNYISSLSMLIYIIHENIILRTYFRPQMWNYVYKNYGYSHIILWVFVLAILIFCFSVFVAALYSVIIQKLVRKLSNRLYELLKKKYLELEEKLIEKI